MVSCRAAAPVSQSVRYLQRNLRQGGVQQLRAFLYAGQGSQFAGMGQDFYKEYPVFREILDSADLDFDHKKLMFEGPEEILRNTRYTQPCMAVFAAGVTAVLESLGIRPDAACGLSLGEYGALYAAGVWDTETYLCLVNFRGKAMEEAGKNHQVVMAAVVGAEAENVEKACREASGTGFVKVVNYNCPGQYVICGDQEAVAAVKEYVKKEYRAKCAVLKTSGPFHTLYMKKVGDKLKEIFRKKRFNQPRIPIAMNVTGRLFEDTEKLEDLLKMQVQSPVLFEDDLKTLISLGCDEFIEIGPGKILSGLLVKTARSMGVKVKTAAISGTDDIKTLRFSTSG